MLGISNVSFGLPPAGREVLNSVFLYHCVQAGLDLAIVNAEKLERYPSIPAEERKLAEDLLWKAAATGSPVARAFAAHFRERKAKAAPASASAAARRAARPLHHRGLARTAWSTTWTKLLKERTPLDIINGPLMTGMDEVGRLFNDEPAHRRRGAAVAPRSMKAAVGLLEPHMDKADRAATRGTSLLATVKGDVHDIGKNLVDIILSNNGFEVVNLGIKVPPEKTRSRPCASTGPDIIGLSRPAGEVGAADGRRPRRTCTRAGIGVPDPGRRRGALRNFVDKRDRARLPRHGRVRQRRDERARPRQ